MVFALAAAGLALLSLPGLARPAGRRLPPDRWAVLCAAALVMGSAAVEAAALSWAAPTVLRAADLAGLASVCSRLLGPLVPGGPTAGWGGLVVAVGVAGLGAAAVGRARRRSAAVMIVEPWLGERHRVGEHELVVLPTARRVAVSVPGPRAQILVSEGLRDLLSAEDMDLVVRHEAAHLDSGHHRYLLLAAAADAAFAMFPPVRGSTRALRAALERWADDMAVGADARSRARLRSVLMVVADIAPVADLAALSDAMTVAERLAALDAPPAEPAWWAQGLLMAPWASLGLVAAFAAGAWLWRAQWVLGSAGRCIMRS